MKIKGWFFFFFLNPFFFLTYSRYYNIVQKGGLSKKSLYNILSDLEFLR